MKGAFFVGQSDKFIVFLRCRREVPAENFDQACPEQGKQQSGGLADVARFLERLLCVHKRSFRIASHPLRPRPKAHVGHTNVCAKACRERTMLRWIVEGYAAIKMGQTVDEVTCGRPRRCPLRDGPIILRNFDFLTAWRVLETGSQGRA